MIEAKEISVGNARIIYKGQWWGRDEWALPGRKSTFDKDEAEAMAETIDALSVAGKLIEILRGTQ